MDQHTQPGDNTRVAQMLKILDSLETRIPRIILRRVDEPLTVIISERENTNTLVAETEIDTPSVDTQTAKIEDDLHIPISLQEVKEEVKLSPHTPVAQMAVTTWPAEIASHHNGNTAINLGSVSNMEPANPQNVMKVHEDQLKQQQQQGQTFEDVAQQQRSLLKTPSPVQTCSVYIKIEDSNRYTEAEHPSSSYSTTCVESSNTAPIDCSSESDVLNPAMVWQEQANDQQMNATEKSKEEEKIIGNVTESDFPICYNNTVVQVAHQQNSTASVPVGEISVDNNGCYSFNVDKQIDYNYAFVNQKPATLVSVFMCDVCGLLFDDLLLLNHHKRIHSTTDTSTVAAQNSQTLAREFQYTCDICQSCFNLASELNVHKNKIHGKNNHIQNHQKSCNLSGACHLNSGKGNCHLHTGKEKDSVKLGKCEGSKKINSVNVPGTDFRSDVCNEGNSARNLAENPEQEFKPDYNPVKLKGFKVIKTCHECNGSGICISGPGSRNDTSSHDKPYVCNICGNTFSRYTGLWSHRRLHSSDKPFKCGVCGLAFARQSYLQNHSRIHTGEKPYKCSVCEKQFSQIPHLRNHERIHSGERPYQCQVCNKTFSRHSTLWNHRRIHTGEKPYECDICGSAFNQAAHLKTHTRVHTGEKPYRCDICNLGFSDKFSMERHRAIHKKYAAVKDPNASNNSDTSDENTVSHVDGNNDDITIKRLNLKLQYKLNATR